MTNVRPLVWNGGADPFQLTTSDPRHRANGGAAGGAGSVTLKNVTLFDADAASQEIMRTPHTEKVILNIVRAKPRAFKEALG